MVEPGLLCTIIPFIGSNPIRMASPARPTLICWRSSIVVKYVKYSKKLLEDIAQKSTSICEMMRYLDASRTSGSHHQYIKSLIKKFNIDISHFPNPKLRGALAASSKIKRSPSDILKKRSGPYREKVHILRRAMLESRITEMCSGCGVGPIWQGRRLVLQIDHVDGDPLNNELNNVRFLCPNCHSQTNTYGKVKSH